MRFALALTLLICASRLCFADDFSAQVLAELNFARTAPREYAELLATRMATYQNRNGHGVVDDTVRFLRNTKSLAPLAYSEGLSSAAFTHVVEQGATGALGHGDPWRRMARFGQWLGCAGENISYGARDARSVVMALIVDDGIPRQKHRANIFNGKFGVAGVASGRHPRFGAMCVMDFAGSFVARGTGHVAGL